jgi:hypothetical protein
VNSWMKECAKWCPSLVTFKFHGNLAQRNVLRQQMLDPSNDVVRLLRDFTSLSFTGIHVALKRVLEFLSFLLLFPLPHSSYSH